MNIFKKIKEKNAQRITKQLDRRARTMYQLKERDGEIWLTYEGCYVCPCSMLNEAPVEAVCKLRTIFKRRALDE